MTSKTGILIAVAVLLFAAWTVGAFLVGKNSAAVPLSGITVDTVIVRETIRDTVLVPQVRWLVRTDTVLLTLPGDTVRVEVEVPIERKVYQTEDYMATVEGFRPALVDMEVYRHTQYVTRTETVKVSDRRRWGLGVQIGYGYNFDRFYPYVGVGLQYSLITW